MCTGLLIVLIAAKAKIWFLYIQTRNLCPILTDTTAARESAALSETSVFNLCCLLWITEPKKTRLGVFLAAPPGTLCSRRVSLCFIVKIHIAFLYIYLLQCGLKQHESPLYDSVENHGDVCADLCFGSSAAAWTPCFHFHFSCRALLKMIALIFNTVTFVIAQKAIPRETASQVRVTY